MTGPISFEFAATVLGIVAAAVTGVVWIIQVFQTKADAAESEKRMREQFDKEIGVIRKSVEDVHRHLEAVRVEFRDQMKTVHLEIKDIRERDELTSRDVSWIRGRLEVGMREISAG